MSRVIAWLCTVDIRRAALLLFGSVALVGIIGVVTIGLDPENPWFDLDSELGLRWPITETTLALPAIWSAILFAGGGAGWLLVARLSSPGWTAWLALVLGCAMLFFALDELFIIHERFEARSGIEWLFIYVPVVAVTATAILGLAWRLRTLAQRVPLMLVVGSLCWAATIPLELAEWRGSEQARFYELMMVPEELLELAGSILIGLAAITVVQLLASEQESATGTR